MFAVLPRLAVAASTLCLMLPAAFAAQDPVFANRPIQIVVGFPAGGIFETVNRILIGFMERDLKVQMIPVPLPGAGAAIAMQKVARGSADGHTLMLVPSTALLSRPIIMGLPINYRDFVPIASVAVNFTMIAVKKDHSWRSLDDLIRDAAKRPDKLSYAIPGIGGNPHFAMELVAPRGTPQRPIQVLEASANRAVANADVRKGIERQGLEAVFESGQALARALREQSVTYERLITDLGLVQSAKRGN